MSAATSSTSFPPPFHMPTPRDFLDEVPCVPFTVLGVKDHILDQLKELPRKVHEYIVTSMAPEKQKTAICLLEGYVSSVKHQIEILDPKKFETTQIFISAIRNSLPGATRGTGIVLRSMINRISDPYGDNDDPWHIITGTTNKTKTPMDLLEIHPERTLLKSPV